MSLRWYRIVFNFRCEMFFFLSKLLPLLVYPLGFSLLLLCLALYWLKRHPKRARIAIASSIAILWLSSTPLLRNALISNLEQENLPPENLPSADLIIVLGGATRSPTPPRPWVDLSEEGDRIIHAARLYQQGKAPKVLVSGGRIGFFGAESSEAEDMAQILEFMGVPSESIIQEPNSYNTRENAIYSKAVLEEQDLAPENLDILLITSAMHMPRARRIFEKLGMAVTPAPTDFLIVKSESPSDSRARLISLLPQAQNLHFVSRAMKEYIGLFVYRLKGWA